MSPQARLAAVDVAKGIAILSIMVGHIGFYDSSGTELTGPWLYQFHVPIFFLIAGYFLKDTSGFWQFASQKIRRLLGPYVITGLCILIGIEILVAITGSSWPSVFSSAPQELLALLYGSGSWYNLTPCAIVPIGAIWFLPALFFGLLLGRISLRWKNGWLFTLVCAGLAFFSARFFWLPLSIQAGMMGAFFISGGVFLRKHDFLSKPVSPLLFLVCLCIFIAAGISNAKLSIASLLTASDFPISVVIAIAASLLVMMLSQLIAQYVTPLTRVLAFYGKGTLPLLCLHLFLLDMGFGTLLALAGLSGNLLSTVNLALQLLLVSIFIPLSKKSVILRTLFW